MPFITVGREKTLAAVATRVLTRAASNTAHAAAVEALAAANPGATLEPGAVLVVPPLTSGRVNLDDSHPGSLAELMTQVHAGLDELADAISEQATLDAEQRDETTQVLASSDFKRVASKDTALRTRVSELSKTLRAETKVADSATEQWHAAISQWRTDLDTLPTDTR